MKYIFLLSFMVILTACANVAMPTGGPRDKTPPELVQSLPTNNEKNFKRETIELTFNEDIKLKDPKEEILIIPSFGKKTLFTVKKKKLIIKPELSLLENTTYSINFRDGVQDLTEGNPAENLKLAFSTGPDIDSLSIFGNVKETFSEKIPTKITVALYQSDTFDIFKHTPTYFTKSDKGGHFNITNLKSGTYYIYSFEDKNKNLKVDSKSEQYGFITKPIIIEELKDSVNIAMIMVDSRPITLTNIRHTDKISRIKFNKPIDSLLIKGITTSEAIFTYGTDQSEILFYNFFQKEDSLKTRIIAIDSIGQKVDTTIYIKHGQIKTSPESLKTKEIDLKYNFIDKTITYHFTYNKPIAQINIDSIYIRYDSLITSPIAIKNIHIDTLLNQVTIKSKVEENDISEQEKKGLKPPELIIGKNAFITIEQDSSKRIRKSLNISKEEDLGLVSVKVDTKEKNYILQLTTNGNKVVQSLLNIKEHTFKYLEPLEYRIRIIIDTNQNGKWDPGNIHNGIQPEKIILFKSEEGKHSFPLRANWEYGPVLIKF